MSCSVWMLLAATCGYLFGIFVTEVKYHDKVRDCERVLNDLLKDKRSNHDEFQH